MAELESIGETMATIVPASGPPSVGIVAVTVDEEGFNRPRRDPVGIGLFPGRLGAMLTVDQAKQLRDALSKAIDIAEAATLVARGAS